MTYTNCETKLEWFYNDNSAQDAQTLPSANDFFNCFLLPQTRPCRCRTKFSIRVLFKVAHVSPHSGQWDDKLKTLSSMNQSKAPQFYRYLYDIRDFIDPSSKVVRAMGMLAPIAFRVIPNNPFDVGFSWKLSRPLHPEIDQTFMPLTSHLAHSFAFYWAYTFFQGLTFLSLWVWKVQFYPRHLTAPTCPRFSAML